MIGLCALEGLLGREVAMNTPLISVIIVIALIVGSTLSVRTKPAKAAITLGAPQCPPYGIILKLSRRPDCDCRPEPRPPCWPAIRRASSRISTWPQCPLYPQKRTLELKRTHALQQLVCLL